MKIFNRMLIVILTLAVMAVSLLLLLLQVFDLNAPENVGLPLWLTEKIFPSIESDWQTRLTFTGICAGAFVLGAVFLYIELRQFFFNEPRFLILQDDLGKVEITESCIGKFINQQARLFSDISDVNSQIINKKDGLQIKSRIIVKPGTKISELGRNLQNHLKTKLESNLGLLISDVIITAEVGEAANHSQKSLR